jgi:hypothetical protein
VPRGSGARLECNTGAGNPGWLWRREQAINPHPAGKVVIGTFARRLRAHPFDFHYPVPSFCCLGRPGFL